MQMPNAGHVVSQRMPERDAPRLLATAYREAKQAAIAGLGVGKFGRRRPFPIDRLGLLPVHAPAPSGQFRRILWQGQMAIAPSLARPGYRYVGGHSAPRRRVSLVEEGTTQTVVGLIW